MAELGHDVLGIENDAEKIAALASGQAPFYEPGLAELLVKTALGHDSRIGLQFLSAGLGYGGECLPEKACEGADVVLHLTEWSQYRELDPAELRSVVRVPGLLDWRNVLPLGRWPAAGWTVQSMGAASAAVGADA